VSVAPVPSGRPREETRLASRPRVPEHVVYRTFVNETVVLNLETGAYHGLNPVGGRMLAALDGADSVAHASPTRSGGSSRSFATSVPTSSRATSARSAITSSSAD
jgi:hypothetical protein